MELQQIRYFLALKRTLNFSEAAKQCNVTQPALTRAVQRLEQDLGGELIHREGRLTHLSDLGKAVLPMLERTLAAADSVTSQAKDFWSRTSGKLRIGLIPSVSAFLMTEPLSELSLRAPGLQIDLIEDKNENLIQALLDGDIHAALGDGTEELPMRIDHWQLFEERYVVVTSAGHQFASLTEIPIDLLQEATWLQRDIGEATNGFESMFPGAPGKWRVSHRAQQEAYLQHMAAIGAGALLAPEHAPLLPTLVSRPIKNDPLRRRVELLTVAGRRYSPILELFVKISRCHNWQRTLAKACRDPAATKSSWLQTDLEGFPLVPSSALLSTGVADFNGS